MRRSIALAGLAVATVLTASPATAAQQIPPQVPALEQCDIFQNCICGIVASALYRVTGEHWLHCV